MDCGRDAYVVGAFVEGLEELQGVRDAIDQDEPDFARQFEAVFEAAIAFYRAAIPIRALLLTDHQLGAAYRDRVAGATGLGPQLPMLELAHWLELERRRGRIDPSLDIDAAALMVCGTADYVATLHLVVDDANATAAYGDLRRVTAHLLSSLTGRRTAVVED